LQGGNARDGKVRIQISEGAEIEGPITAANGRQQLNYFDFMILNFLALMRSNANRLLA
jgi:hypothetical protein